METEGSEPHRERGTQAVGTEGSEPHREKGTQAVGTAMEVNHTEKDTQAVGAGGSEETGKEKYTGSGGRAEAERQ